MTDHTTWHADDRLVARYADGTLPTTAAASLEAHLVECEQCRAAVPAPSDRHERMWLEVVDRIDAPRPSAVERLLRRIGVSEETARMLALTPSLTMSWMGAVVAVLAFAVAAAHGASGDRGFALFLIIAPMVPTAGVAAAYGAAFDPSHELTAATPMSGLRLLLLRGTAVAVVSTLVAGIAALALPGPGWTATAWLIPALVLTTATLALTTFMTSARALGLVVGGWLLGCVGLFAHAARRTGRVPDVGDYYVGLDPVGRGLLVSVGLVALLVLIQRRDTIGQHT